MLHAAQPSGARAMKILVSGSTGLVGSDLLPLLTSNGHIVTRLARGSSPASGQSVPWEPDAGRIDSSALDGFDAVVHLSGENIASGRWNAERKARIRDSRVKGTRLLCDTL